MKTLILSSAKFPRTAHLARWARLLGLSEQTLIRYRIDGKLQGGEKRLNKRVYYTREEICRAFNIPLEDSES